MPPHLWHQKPKDELDGFWTVDLTSRTVVVPFESDHEFTAGTSAQIATLENNFVRDTPGSGRVIEFNYNEGGRDDKGNLINAKNGAHIRVRAG